MVRYVDMYMVDILCILRALFRKLQFKALKSISHRKKQPIWYGINLVLRRNCLVGSAWQI